MNKHSQWSPDPCKERSAKTHLRKGLVTVPWGHLGSCGRESWVSLERSWGAETGGWRLQNGVWEALGDSLQVG